MNPNQNMQTGRWWLSGQRSNPQADNFVIAEWLRTTHMQS